MRKFKFFPGFLPFNANYGYKGKIIEYCEEEIMVNGDETRSPRADFVHMSDCPHYNIFNFPSSSAVYLRRIIMVCRPKPSGRPLPSPCQKSTSEFVHQVTLIHMEVLIFYCSNPSFKSICPAVNPRLSIRGGG